VIEGHSLEAELERLHAGWILTSHAFESEESQGVSDSMRSICTQEYDTPPKSMSNDASLEAMADNTSLEPMDNDVPLEPTNIDAMDKASSIESGESLDISLFKNNSVKQNDLAPTQSEKAHRVDGDGERPDGPSEWHGQPGMSVITQPACSVDQTWDIR
jgi:hypothetical protein